jgi:uncharacterized protein
MSQTHNFSLPSTVGAPPLRFEENLDLSALPLESIHRFHIGLSGNSLGTPIFVPVVVIRGKYNRPVVGVTSTIHGNELNGIPVIHRLLPTIDPAQLRGTVVAVPVVNTPGYLNQQRRFND